MRLDEIRLKRRKNEEAQDELLLSRKKFEFQQDEIRQTYFHNRQLKEEVLEYFYGEPEQYLFEDGLEETRRDEDRFLESSEKISGFLSKESMRLSEENETLYEEERKELKESKHG
ncbi:hypothetical protein I6N96_16925 [Enterococcus sp. BWM-S5]|uniref:Uncharacterized protein n=1 Tax=Enterococcus larvae TaxID=2794352 RepID=A0ABS4CN16_9ENTE|nr:hypothetical protein [Enterococcus larvae]MBP1047976.1 hypothetical protein [Enterococcus larvae]